MVWQFEASKFTNSRRFRRVLRKNDAQYLQIAGNTLIVKIQSRSYYHVCADTTGEISMSRLVSIIVAFLFFCSFGVASAQQNLVGSFNVDDGPAWATNPPTYSCVEACATVFGGTGAEYSCSTTDQSIDNQAYVSGWGDGQYCTTPVAEDFKLNTFYNCGSTGCAYSAYVSDHCSDSINYCYSATAGQPAVPVPGMNRTGILLLSVMILLAGFGIQRFRLKHR